VDVAEAVADKLTPSAYSYDGQLEKLKCHIDLQSEMIVKLVTLIEAKLKISAEEMEELLGYGYKVED
jgi:hypothetical protein